MGGTFIIGTAETVYDPKLGLIWAVMPLAATLAFIVGKIVIYNSNISHKTVVVKLKLRLCCVSLRGGHFFAEPMRDRKFVTMMDPFHLKYGDRLTGLLSVAPLLSEIVWVTSTLISLGNNLSCRVNVCSEAQPVLRHVNSHTAVFTVVYSWCFLLCFLLFAPLLVRC